MVLTDSALAVSVVAVLVACLALIVVLGSALRVQRLESGTAEMPRLRASPSLPIGATVDRDAIARLVGEKEAKKWVEGPSLLAFVSADCPPCAEIVRSISTRPALVSHALMIQQDGENYSKMRSLGASDAHWVLDRDQRATRAFSVTAFPQCFALAKGEVTSTHLGDHADEFLSSLEIPLSVAAHATGA